MTGRPLPLPLPVAAVVWVFAAAVPLTLALLIVVTPTLEADAWAIPVYTCVATSWAVVGAAIATRRPRHPVGWIVFGTGVLLGTALIGQEWALLSAIRFGGSLPLTVAGWWSSLLFNPALGFALIGLPLWFPDGRLPSSRWRIVAGTAIGAMLALVLATIVKPGDLESFPGVPNPTGVPELADAATAVIEIANVVFLLCVPICLAAPFLRYRRGTLVERQQLKWFGSAAALAVAGIVLATVLPEPYGVAAFVVTTIAIGLVPVTIGIAILRYHLYEIDRIVGRTLAYAVLTAVLAGAFVGTNLIVQAILVDAIGGATFTTALSTLVVAGMFQPLRRRVQTPIDRRFNRARVDGERVVAAFAGQLRDQVDLDRLRSAVVHAVDDAVAPAGSSIWLRRAR